MSAIVTIRINCDGKCGNFRVVETASTTTARRMLAQFGWKVVLKNNNGSNGRTYGDKCPDCPADGLIPTRYKEQSTASQVIGDALPRRKKP